MKHLVIVDGHHLMYRAYWAIPRTLKNKKGDQVNAVFGVASMLISILNQEKPDALLMAFDKGEETFRHAENATYKEGRAETPDDFYIQVPKILGLVDAFSFPQVSDTKYEADDFLCTYAHSAVKAGMRVTIVTGDRDAFQLANEHVRIAIPHKGYQQAEYLGPDEIFAKYGIRPDQVPAYKGLIGDSSDNLPGVKGIGPKSGSALLQQFDTLENLYAHLDQVKSESVRAKLEADKEAAFFCQRMARLVCDIPLPVGLDDLLLQDLPTDNILAYFREMDFTLLQKRLQTLTESEYGRHIFGAMTPIAAVSAQPAVREEKQQTLF